MGFKLGHTAISLIALGLFLGIGWYQWDHRVTPVGASITFYQPVLSPYPQLEGVKVPVNTASLEELEQLPGIGPTKAKAIQAYIREHGPFTNKKQLLEVDGIGQSTWEELLPYITLEAS